MEEILNNFFDFQLINEDGASESIRKIKEHLKVNEFYTDTGEDKILRAPFVGLQNNFEEYLVSLLVDKKVAKIQAFIHTPKPATPLCTLHGDITEVFRQDQNSLRENTVQSRVLTINNFINNGGKLFVVYTQEGLQKLDDKDKSNFTQNLNLLSNIVNVKVKDIDSNNTGAFYIIEVDDESSILFSLKAYQKDDQKEGEREWSIWLGSMNSSKISDRVNYIQKLIIRFLEEKQND